MREPHRRWGFVAAAAVCMLAMVAALAAATFHTVVEVRRSAHRVVRQEEATSAADVGLHAVLEGWDVAVRESVAVGTLLPVGASAVRDSGERSHSVIARLTPSIYWIAAMGRAAIGTSVGAIRVHNLLVETREPVFPTEAALIARADVVASPGLTILGGDSAPPGWPDCPPASTAPAPAIILGEGSWAGFDDRRPIPNVHSDSVRMLAATSGAFGNVDFESLAARRTLVLGAGAILSPQPGSSGDCQLGRPSRAPTDWGDPRRTGPAGCDGFYPVVVATGDLTLRTGSGQGVLLVAGRLRIEGPFAFHGVIFTRGGIVVSGPEIAIYGVVISASTTLVRLASDGVIARSTCAVARAAEAAVRAYPLRHRAWAELY